MISVEHQLRERAGLLEEAPYRRGYRAGILQHAVEPLRPLLGQKGTNRLIMALAMVYGIEPYVVWKDIFGASDREVESLAKWMAESLVDAALRDARRIDGHGAPASSLAARSKQPGRSGRALELGSLPTERRRASV